MRSSRVRLELIRKGIFRILTESGYISRRLARLMDGDIIVESEIGQGSVFRLRIPLVEAMPEAADDQEEPAALDRCSLTARRILVAEDLPINRWLIQRQLERLGFSVAAVEDGPAALAAIAATAYDLLITDCHMPGMDGTELTRRIRDTEAASGGTRLPIIALTADITERMREECRAAGIDDVVAKPVSLDRLEAAIVRLLLGRSASVEPAVTPGTAVFDPGTYRELFADAETEGREWLQFYLEIDEAMLQAVRAAAADGDRGALEGAAHRFAGASLTMGAMALGALCRALEAAAPGAPEAEIARLVAALQDASAAARLEILRFAAGGPKPVA